jgi:hypothetical protein
MIEVSKKNKILYKEGEQWYGYLLLLISVTAEAFFSDSQAYVKITYKPSKYQLMYSVNCITALLSISSLLIKSQGMKSIRFCLNHN